MKMSEEKIKVVEAEIVVHGTATNPYYEIKYREPGKKDYNINVGYSSFDIENVFKWREELFEFVDESKVKETVYDTNFRISSIKDALDTLLCCRKECIEEGIISKYGMLTIIDILYYLAQFTRYVNLSILDLFKYDTPTSKNKRNLKES